MSRKDEITKAIHKEIGDTLRITIKKLTEYKFTERVTFALALIFSPKQLYGLYKEAVEHDYKEFCMRLNE